MPPLDTGAAERDPDVYDWRTAPAHLMTRRQLRAAGLRPGGQQPVAWVPVQWRGRTQLAGLYDSRRAAPKRIATPAQLRAVAKAIREHQARAAERRGYSRAELSRVTDPGPGWTHTPNTTEKGNTMSDTEIHAEPEVDLLEVHHRAHELERDLELAQRDAPVWPDAHPEAAERLVRIQEELDAHLRRWRGELSNNPHWDSYYQGIDHADDIAAGQEEAAANIAAAYAELYEPTGPGQRMTYLLATVAVNQARDRREQLAADAAHAEGRGAEAVAWYRGERAKAQAEAEARLATNSAQLGPASVAPLADALVWHQDSPVAAERLGEITAAYGAGWGVVVDPDQLTVSIDPDVDATVVQDYTEAAALRAREAAAVDVVTALPLTEQARAQVDAAMTAWLGTDIDPAHPRAYLDTAADRRAQLAAALTGLGADDRARVDFVVDYLRADLQEVDLLDTPVWVDPGQEVRGRVPRMLEAFAIGQYAGKEIAEEISVMTREDQQRVRQAGKAIAARQPVDIRLWPGYVDRTELAEELHLYALDAEELRGDADYLPKAVAEDVDNPQLWGLSDDVEVRIDRLASRREELLAAAAGGEGLHPLERAQLEVTLGDLDAGRIRDHKELPELLWADERSKAEADELRVSSRGGELSAATRDAVTQRLAAAGVDVDARDNNQLRDSLDRIGDSVYSVACGASTRGMDYERKAYVDKRARLGQALANAGVDQAARAEIRAVIDGRAPAPGAPGPPPPPPRPRRAPGPPQPPPARPPPAPPVTPRRAPRQRAARSLRTC
ncbi:RRQRL motif-containing zinc-binding protein, partial [Nocardia wallacei]|uniref:RRQRL motif-containing zinc-binding protein n=1 Tax=Nocardia wallacei TaxID=480035 RepID=UPI002457EBED